MVTLTSNCGSSNGSSQTPPTINVTIQPTSANLFLGQTQQFQASVTGTTNTGVTWEVNGTAGGSASTGTISGTGLYTAPEILPSSPSVTVTAVSQADGEASASATVTLKDDLVVAVSPNTVNISTGGAQVFTATVSGTGNPPAGVTWSVNGIVSGNSTVGTIVTTGTSGNATTAVYTAPPAPPSPASVTITATSTADSTKSGSATATVICSASNSISPSSVTVPLGQTQAFTASFCLPGGSSIVWDVNGVTGGNATLGTITSSSPSGATFAAPTDMPSTNPVTIHATVSPPPTGGAVTAAATVTLTSSISVTVSPSTAILPLGQRASFTASVANSADTSVTWSVNAIANGNATVGQVCQSGTSPCAAPTGPSSAGVDYLAPAAVPTMNPVTLTATSHADPSRSGAASILIAGPSGGGPVGVSVSPPYAFLPVSASTPSTLQFYAAVTNATTKSVTWNVASAVAGQGCAGVACGSVDATGLYTAPSAAPSPNAVAVTATSIADSTKSASAVVALTSGPMIETILPSSVMGGAVISFPLVVQGLNFVAGSGSSASMILLNGTPRATSCATTVSCATALNPSDVQSPGSLTIQVQNPGAPSVLSNPVPFVIIPFNVSQDTIALSSAAPVATEKDITVAEPTTATSSPFNVDFVGYFLSGNCSIQGSPLSVTRPASGSTSVTICVHGTGLDPSFAYLFTGPGIASGGTDITVTAAPVTGLFPNVIALNMQISSTTLPGVRTLLVTTLNSDRAVATGMLEVK